MGLRSRQEVCKRDQAGTCLLPRFIRTPLTYVAPSATSASKSGAFAIADGGVPTIRPNPSLPAITDRIKDGECTGKLAQLLATLATFPWLPSEFP